MARAIDIMGAGLQAQTARAAAGTFATVTAAGTTQGTATVLSAAANNVTTAASQTGVVLPTGAQGSMPGDVVFVFVNSATSGSVYPGGSDKLNGSTSAITVAQNKMLTCVRMSATAWGAMVTA